jgi:hypothetical protein
MPRVVITAEPRMFTLKHINRSAQVRIGCCRYGIARIFTKPEALG